MAHICSIASKALVAAMLCAGIFPGALSAQPLPAYDAGQPANDPNQYNNTRPDAAPAAPLGIPQAGLPVPVNPKNGPAPDAADPGLAGNLNLAMPDVNFQSLLTKLQAPAQTTDPFNQNTTPDTTSAYTTSQPPPNPAQHDLATPIKLP